MLELALLQRLKQCIIVVGTLIQQNEQALILLFGPARSEPLRQFIRILSSLPPAKQISAEAHVPRSHLDPAKS